MKRINFYKSELYMRALKSISAETDLSVSEHIRRAVDIYIGIYSRDKNAWDVWNGETKKEEK